jgi:phytoene dehydrogenase-like protein
LAADVTIIGAGLAGLACAKDLIAKGLRVEILEASDRPGGRVRTDSYRGFQLDRGFQVLLTAYPECKKRLDYAALDLKPFYSGSLIWFDGKFHKVADPWRHPAEAISSLGSPIGNFADKIRVGGLRDSVRRGSIDHLFDAAETSTIAALQNRRFSPEMIDRFFRPFFGGVFLDSGLETSSRMFEFVFRMFSEGDAALPAAGMEAISRQLAWGLPIFFDEPVGNLRSVNSRHTVIATEGPEAANLLGMQPPKPGRHVKCFYFAADQDPVKEPIIVLNGEGHGPVNNFCVPSTVAPSYAPKGASLLSASVLGNATELQVREHLQQWFGAQVKRWVHLRTYDIPYAQPDQSHVPVREKPVRIRPGLYVCGDHVENSSLNGAILSGQRAAEALLSDL